MVSRIVKIVIAVVVTLLCVASMGVLAMRDTSRRPEYCKTCHAVEPYYETWAKGDLLARQHALAAVPCQTCHPQDMQTTLQENVTNLQAGNSVAIVDVAWTNEQCLACHGDEKTLAERTQNLDPNPHASPHVGAKLDCSQCHKMHKPSEDPCTQCHPAKAATPGWTKATQTLKIQVWSPDTDCATCHTMTPYANSLKDTNLLASAHAKQGLACKDCHTDQQALQQAHEKAVPGQEVKPLQVDNQVCFGCHVTNQHTNWEQVIQRTADYVIDGKKINPHNPHPAGADVEELQCFVCHSMHEQSPLITGCYGCHHVQDFRKCGECHAEYLK